ncbi:unnamed protein product [Rotaria magnacalcarata]|uniref:Pre-mRNA-splicing factor RBM22 n=1 Tax=Rotaria magnacalcarata TaxID=392030 RepID=A0A816BNE8_9BILA|nr:unnamed protein product [Rotaria magnacalcarata]CAF1612414.1 unnamed protein product [Rotaria magnacalcarata]CAF1929895.1 unnamed protein product [Rotaria magnacalcarata]CAF1933253.1 unnamed protein product [Rotaria magnacalcarata]CAF2080887.1 unnamed protein product [Rotaria magnacalcarata]
MSISLLSNTYNRQNWEDAEFPILCQTCLGDNPYIRMMKERYGQECKICNRPFTIFRWCPGARMRFKKTEICQTCSKLKNVCQTCLLDLEFGLPVQVRDEALEITDTIPKGQVNKEYFTQNAEVQMSLEQTPQPYGQLAKAQPPSDVLMKLARSAPYYKRNQPHICSFYVKGECKRGEECPYRHEKPTDPDDPLSNQNIRDRFYGVNDPVAEKLLSRYKELPQLETPEDKTVTTLYIGNVVDMDEQQLRDHFYQYGEIRSVTVVPKQSCAFVQFTQRDAAERAAKECFNKLVIDGKRLTVKWGKPASAQGTSGRSGEGGIFETNYEPVPGLPTVVPMPTSELKTDFFGLSSSNAAISAATTSFLPPPPMPPPDLGDYTSSLSYGHMSMPNANGMPPPLSSLRASVHYPSQDPSRVGSTAAHGKPNE